MKFLDKPNRKKQRALVYALAAISIGLVACGSEKEAVQEPPQPVEEVIAETEVEETAPEVIEEIVPEISIKPKECLTQLEEGHYEISYLDYQDNAETVEDLFTVEVYPETSYISELKDTANGEVIAFDELPVDYGNYTYSIYYDDERSAEASVALDIVGPVPGIFTKEDFALLSGEYGNSIDYMNAHPNDNAENSVLNISFNPEFCSIPQDQVPDFKSYRGIGIGSTVDEVLRVYGDTEVVDFSSWGHWYNTAEHQMARLVGYVVQTESGAGVQIEIAFDQNDQVMLFIIEGIYEKYMNKVSNLSELR